jgi:4-hydroxy-3-methylbut-2-en-1-yl diphosphate reductase
MSDPRYIQKSLGHKKAIQPLLEGDYHSALVDGLRDAGYVQRWGDVEVRLAREFGFCYGVDRAVDLAYETRQHFPDKTLYITNEIIHNPYVNRRLGELGVRFLDSGAWSYQDVKAEDVVLLPAFGATTEQLETLTGIGSVLVDTTCGSVMNVWRRVRQYAVAGFSAVVHGKWWHEETLATCSRVTEHGGHYVVVLDHAEAGAVCDYIARRPGAPTREEFLARFKDAVSPGFDPELHLSRVGVANQTTMLSSESLEIADRLRLALEERHGGPSGEGPAETFRSFDTICSATQDRQDAIMELGQAGGMDVVLVVGGYNSSNTGHLAELSARFAPAFHIDGADAIHSLDEIEHQPVHAQERVLAHGWLPEPRGEHLVVGVTSGASTPNRTVGEVIARVLSLRGIELDEPATAGGTRLPVV